MAIFSILGANIIGSNVIDIFCGSGALGIEALSRGAASCTFVDINLSYLKMNLELIKDFNYYYLEGDFFKVYAKLIKNADIIFIDPPYGKYPAQNILDVIAINELIKYNGIIIYEESVKTKVLINGDYFLLKKERIYGDTKIYLIEAKSGNIISRDI